MYYYEPVNDPYFMAHSRGKGDKYQSDANETVYYPDHLFSLMVCTDQQQLCNPNNNMCSPWGSRYDLAMNVGQNVLPGWFQPGSVGYRHSLLWPCPI